MRIPRSNRKYEYFPLQGGEDLTTSALVVDPGRLKYSRNYECDLNGKYRRIDGYERLDGRPKPSEASYWVMDFDAGVIEIVVDSWVEGDTSGAVGKVLLISVASGTWAGGDAAGTLILYNVSGTFVNNETLLAATPLPLPLGWPLAGTIMGVADGVATERGADNDTDDETYYHAAIEATRDSIEAVPGSGSILGTWMYGGASYAFRNNAGGTAAAMYKSTGGGWELCSLGERLGWDTGTVAFVEGETIFQAGVHAVVRRVVLQSGTYAGGDAEGYFVITGRVGASFAAGAVTGSIAGAVSALGTQTTNAFSVPSGRFECINYNFGGHSSTLRMYGCDGKNKAFEWDGTYFTPIETGMTTDTPTHIIAHEKHLFLSFSGGSLQHSSIGDPFTWSAVTGAAEFGLGAEITGLLSQTGVLAIWGRNAIALLYGSSPLDWYFLTKFSAEAGGIEWTIQDMGASLYLDDRGITSLYASEKYGDFSASALSQLIQPFLKTMKKLAQSSIRVREKTQYRLFFTDLQALTLTLRNGKVIGFTRQLLDRLPVCTCSAEDSTGSEVLLFGSTDGFTYQMDAGTSFDGRAIEAILRPHYYHFKSPQHDKEFYKIVLEMDAPSAFDLRILPETGYGDAGGPYRDVSVGKTGGIWDVSVWGSFTWDTPIVSQPEASIDGVGPNIAFVLYSSGIYEAPHTIQGAIVHFKMLGMLS